MYPSRDICKLWKILKSGVTDLGFKLQELEDNIKGILDIFYC